MARQSLIEFLDEYGRRGKEVAVAHRRGYRMERWSYARIAETARGFASELAARGIVRGQRVVLWGDNCAEWVAAFFGCVLRGVVVAPIDRVATAEFAGRVAQTVEAKLVIGSRDVPEIYLQNGAAVQKIALEDVEEIAARHVVTQSVFANDIAAKNVRRTDTVEIVFTSGTTAEPRGVVLTHGNILANIEPLEAQIQEYLRYEKFMHPLRFLNLLPLSHVFGQLMSMFIPPLLGGTVIFLDTLGPAEVARTIRRERVTALVSVPRLIESLQGQVEREIEAEGRVERFRKDFAAADGEHFLKRCWRFRRVHGQLGWKFWALISGGAALPEKRGDVLAEAGLRGDSGIRADGDDFAGEREPSVSYRKRLDWEGDAGDGNQVERGRRDSGARRKCGVGILARAAARCDGRCGGMVSHGRFGGDGRGRESVFQGAAKKRDCDAGGDECLSRGFGSGAAAASGRARLRGGGNRARRKCRTVFSVAA